MRYGYQGHSYATVMGHFYCSSNTKNGDLKECRNYRTISLISNPSKVLLWVILNRLQPQIEPLLADKQAKCRSGRGTVEQILNLKLLCEKSEDHKEEILHNFIDFTKAFDRVWHEGLWVKMKRHRISRDIIDCIKAAYNSSECRVMCGSMLSYKVYPLVSKTRIPLVTLFIWLVFGRDDGRGFGRLSGYNIYWRAKH